ncbi:hypothetical protein N183_34380 [Sinorhizobium sp. Sb3]|nr:hypothetical protein N183_34380 [Sinorhizobium sp. Sb3]
MRFCLVDIYFVSHGQAADVEKGRCSLKKMAVSEIGDIFAFKWLRAARHGRPPNTSMRMCVYETWHNDAAGCIDGFSRRDFSACGNLRDFDTGDPSLPDKYGSPFVKRLAVAGD